MNVSEQLIELKTQTEKLLSLLNEDETGFGTWWMFLKERLDRIEEIKKNLGM